MRCKLFCMFASERVTNRSRLLLERIKEQPTALRHAPLTNIQKSLSAFMQRFILCAVFLTIYFCKSLLCAVFWLFVFARVYFARSFFEYLFRFWLYIFVYLIKITIKLNVQKSIAKIRVHKRRSIQYTEKFDAICAELSRRVSTQLKGLITKYTHCAIELKLRWKIFTVYASFQCMYNSVTTNTYEVQREL